MPNIHQIDQNIWSKDNALLPDNFLKEGAEQFIRRHEEIILEVEIDDSGNKKVMLKTVERNMHDSHQIFNEEKLI